MASRTLLRAAEHPTSERLAVRFGGRLARRFVAGDDLEDGLAVADELARSGRRTTLNLVGEHVHDAATADRVLQVYEAAVGTLADLGHAAGVSVKPSQVGAPSDLHGARKRLLRLAEAAAGRVEHVTLDMEDSTVTEMTIGLVEFLHAEGHRQVGCALQAYLHRTPDDVARLGELGASVRLCKGGYGEPAAIAHQQRDHVDAAYRRLTTELLALGTLPRFATHDHRLIGYVRREARRLGRSSRDYELQMLYGVRADLQRRLADLGERVCVYVPFGSAWYPYFVRRLAERPANLGLVLRALWRRRGAM